LELDRDEDNLMGRRSFILVSSVVTLAVLAIGMSAADLAIAQVLPAPEVPAPRAALPTTSTLPFLGQLVLDGADDYAEAADHAELDLGDDESFTLEAWFQQETPSSYLPNRLVDIVHKSGSYRLALTIGMGSEHTMCILFWLPQPDAPYSGITRCGYAVADRKYHHIAGVYDDVTGEIGLYLDGSRQSMSTGLPQPSVSTNTLRVGYTTGAVPQLTIDEVRISGLARYTGTFYSLPSSAFACDDHTRALWHFDEITGTAVFHNACGADVHVLVGHNGAHAEGVYGHTYLPLIVR
jgi:hypothetical protein